MLDGGREHLVISETYATAFGLGEITASATQENCNPPPIPYARLSDDRLAITGPARYGADGKQICCHAYWRGPALLGCHIWFAGALSSWQSGHLSLNVGETRG